MAGFIPVCDSDLRLNLVLMELQLIVLSTGGDKMNERRSGRDKILVAISRGSSAGNYGRISHPGSESGADGMAIGQNSKLSQTLGQHRTEEKLAVTTG